ncbi:MULTISPECIES: hypothetical protein [unclassified Sinorhizobium]|uniref:hypothetical protein n=1 Tax=unclassified Sinorhizobium TaxID=2613772 RepID=UPI0035248CCE
MTISSDLMMALLSMDAYNRGYSFGLAVSGDKIGDAVIGADSSILVDDANERLDISAGFYVITKILLPTNLVSAVWS